MKRVPFFASCAAYGAGMGFLVARADFWSSINPIVVYFLTPLLASLISLFVLGKMTYRFFALLTICLACSLVLFLSFPDPKTPLMGALEYWLLVGIAAFSLLPAALAEGAGRMFAPR